MSIICPLFGQTQLPLSSFCSCFASKQATDPLAPCRIIIPIVDAVHLPDISRSTVPAIRLTCSYDQHQPPLDPLISFNISNKTKHILFFSLRKNTTSVIQHRKAYWHTPRVRAPNSPKKNPGQGSYDSHPLEASNLATGSMYLEVNRIDQKEILLPALLYTSSVLGILLYVHCTEH